MLSEHNATSLLLVSISEPQHSQKQVHALRILVSSLAALREDERSAILSEIFLRVTGFFPVQGILQE